MEGSSRPRRTSPWTGGRRLWRRRSPDQRCQCRSPQGSPGTCPVPEKQLLLIRLGLKSRLIVLAFFFFLNAASYLTGLFLGPSLHTCSNDTHRICWIIARGKFKLGGLCTLNWLKQVSLIKTTGIILFIRLFYQTAQSSEKYSSAEFLSI